MPKSCPQLDLSPADCLREVASILARGVVRWRKQVKSDSFMHASGLNNSAGIGLEVLGKTGLSVSPSTSRLAMRGLGDDE